MFNRLCAMLMPAILFSGCATRTVRFISFPPNATVRVGDRQGRTPCTLKVPPGETEATFRLDSGLEKTVPLPEIDSAVEDVSEGARLLVGRTIQTVGGVACLLGVFVMGVSADNGNDDDRRGTGKDDRNDDDNFLFGLGLAVAGGGVFFVGSWICPETRHPELRVDFLEGEGPQYIDVGYGAKRRVR